MNQLKCIAKFNHHGNFKYTVLLIAMLLGLISCFEFVLLLLFKFDSSMTILFTNLAFSILLIPIVNWIVFEISGREQIHMSERSVILIKSSLFRKSITLPHRDIVYIGKVERNIYAFSFTWGLINCQSRLIIKTKNTVLYAGFGIPDHLAVSLLKEFSEVYKK